MTLEAQLRDAELNAENMLKRAEHSYRLVEATLQELKVFVSNYKFVSKEEEIDFFKHTKPVLYSRLIYFIRIFQIETRMPIGTPKHKRKYLMKEQELIKNYLYNNMDFYRYYRAGSTYLDEQFFLRGRHDLYLGVEGHYVDADPLFTTSHDHKLARIMAYEQLMDYLNAQIECNNIKEHHSSDAGDDGVFRWTDTKAGLIELLYGLQSIGALNNAQIEVKQLAALFEKIFHVDLGNYYRTFQEIRIRKKGRTAFLDKMREMLIKRMDESDENCRGY